ncbi:MAG: cation:proton antiporter [Armatimonadota bacterium]
MQFELLLLLLATILGVAKLSGHISRRYLHQPAVVGELLAGLILGPSVLNMLGWPLFAGSGEWLHEFVTVLAEIGVLLLMFIAGLETDLGQLRKLGKTALWTAISGVLLPMGLGLGTALLFRLSISESIFIGAVLAATSVSISAQTLIELGHMRSRVGTTIMGAAIVDDVLGIVVLSLVVAFNAPPGGVDGHLVSLTLPDLVSSGVMHLFNMPDAALAYLKAGSLPVFIAVFFGLAVLAGRYLGKVMDMAERLRASYAVPAMALLIIFLFSVGAEVIGRLATITGAYMAGIFLARTSQQRLIEETLRPLTYAFFVPVFFISIGLGANVRTLQGSLLFAVLIVAVAILSKVVGCGLGARLTGFTRRESLRVGVGMVSRGEVGLIIAQVGLATAILAPTRYAAIVIMVLLTTVLTPIFLRLLYPPAEHAVEPATEIPEGAVHPEDRTRRSNQEKALCHEDECEEV